MSESESSESGGLSTSADMDKRTKYKETISSKKPKTKVTAVKNRQREINIGT